MLRLLPRPDAAVIDPQMFRTLSPVFIATCAMAALSQAVESITSLAANPISTNMATRAATMIFNSAVKAVQTPFDLELQLQLAIASHLAGIAASQAMPSIAQAIGNNLAVYCHIPYSHCMAVILPYAMEYNLHTAQSELAHLFRAVDPENWHADIPSSATADLLIERTRCAESGTQEGYRQFASHPFF